MIVGLLLCPGSRLFDVAVTQEVFAARLDPEAPRARVRVLAGAPVVNLGGGVQVSADAGLAAVTECDVVVVPGSVLREPTPDPGVGLALRTAYEHGATVASLCTGVFHLAATGLLDGHEATTHWRYAGRLQRDDPKVRVLPDDLYAGSGRLWTSAGVVAGIDLLLRLIRDLAGAAAAGSVARSMVTPAYRPGSQAQYIPGPIRTGGADPVGRLTNAVLAAPGRPWTLSTMAAEIAVSPRTLTRLFAKEVRVSPGAWLIDTRVRIAQALLETGDLPIEQGAARAGFGSADLLRKHFAARFAVSPRAHRAMFRGGGGQGRAGPSRGDEWA